MSLEPKELLQQELSFIEKWEGDQKGLWFWERLGRLPFKILDKLTPAFIQNKIGAMLDELGSFIQNGGQYLTNEKNVLEKIQQQSPERQIMQISDVQQVPLAVMAAVSEGIRKNRGKAATVQGAATGLGGLFTLALDIPVLLGLSLKTLQEIAIIHGYDPNDRAERMFIVKCLQFTSADIVGKEAILNELSFYNTNGSRPKEMMSQLQGWREVVYTYRDQFGWKKLLQMVPVAGMVFGALTNRSMVHDIAETGTMLYRKRRILDRLKELEEKS
ncbi:hypothetical protein CVD28_25075 [Bacillus sp. M6-12]|uniref:EcsC family protein n=1 Tax=Bacillus sp. M6-12 TaxID=2054166 RepID=UPI000C77C8EE|nr:EcsC family protein [Bacillus sp. M6-12]PLS14995.1 hypothetical protein CVD28_25075 [Bacillus sp. M6-12]